MYPAEEDYTCHREARARVAAAQVEAGKDADLYDGGDLFAGGGWKDTPVEPVAEPRIPKSRDDSAHGVL
jgi:hypothetical protein